MANPASRHTAGARVEFHTFFDTPERSRTDHVRAVAQRLAGTPLVHQFLESYPGPTVLLDANRQIVAFNAKAAATFTGRADGELNGSRVGEMVGCVHAFDPPAGCGTTRHCSVCGAAKALKYTATRHEPSMQDCRLTIVDHGKERSLDLRAHASSILIDSDRYTLLAFENVADEKRRETIEHVFFHDVLNTVSVLSGACHLLGRGTDETQVAKVRAIMMRSTAQLVREIQTQRDLVLAEQGDLVPMMEPVSTNYVLDTAHAMYEGAPAARDRRLVHHALDRDVAIRTDATQAVRCLGNLIKNALEAVLAGQTVTLEAHATPGTVVFRIVNPGVIPPEIQLQIFQRSFSSKAERGRGIGTYSVKLIAEQYLAGKVSFVSNERDGTVFLLELPRAL